MRDIFTDAELPQSAPPPAPCAACGFVWVSNGVAGSRCPRCHAPQMPAAVQRAGAATGRPNDDPGHAEAAKRFPEPQCRLCDDAGLLISTDANGNRFAADCECRIAQRTARVLEQARIPRRYEVCCLDQFNDRRSESISAAWRTARDFAEKFPLETAGKGLLLTGLPGLGKTHLAVSILRHVISRGVARNGFFYEHKELLERLRSFYDLRSAGAENTLLRTLITCDLLVLDDLGEVIPSDWVWDTTAYILNARYNENLSTIITTNRPDEPALTSRPGEETSQFAAARIASKRETLGDRIGDRMRSRLMEMCVSLHLDGAPDYREHGKRASFGPGNGRRPGR